MSVPSIFRELGTKQVTVVRHEGTAEETRLDAEAHIQSKSGFFAVSTAVYEGDVVEVPDPRGGTSRKFVAEVSVNDFGPDDMHHIKVVWGKTPPVRIASVRRLSFEGLHPEVARASSDLFTDGHYSAAIGEAFKSLEVRLRTMTGADKSGVALVGEVLGGRSPKIDLATSTGRSGEDEREGFQAIFRGSMQAIRNPKAHEPAADEGPQHALEYLALASLLHRRLDGAENA